LHQIDSSNTKKKGGTILGLGIFKAILQMHGGRIWVESHLGKSSTFRSEFPVDVTNETLAWRPKASAHGASGRCRRPSPEAKRCAAKADPRRWEGSAGNPAAVRI